MKTNPWKYAESLWEKWFDEVLIEVRKAIAKLNQPKHHHKPHPQNAYGNANKPALSDVSSKIQSAVDLKGPRPHDELELQDIAPLPYIDVEVCTCRYASAYGITSNRILFM